MKAKQVLSTMLAAAMVFSVLPGTTVKAEEIDSSTVYIDTEVIDVTLPTTASQKFYIDPQGLVAVGKGGTETANGGVVTGAADMYAINRSSIPLALSVSYKLEDSVTTNGVAIVDTVTDSGAAIKAATDKQIAVSVSAVGSDQDATSGANAYGGMVFKADSDGVDMTDADGKLSTADVVYAKAAGATADYLMTAERYKAKLKSGKTEADAYDSSAYEYVIDTTAKAASCVKLTIGGYCSEKADWSDYANGTETLKLDVVFKFKKVTTDTDGKTTVGATEVVLGPQVSLSTSGVISITNLDGTLWKSMSLNDGTKDWPLTTGKDGTWVWGDAKDAKKEFTLASNWMPSYLAGKTAKVTVTLTDGSTIESASVTFPSAESEESGD